MKVGNHVMRRSSGAMGHTIIKSATRMAEWTEFLRIQWCPATTLGGFGCAGSLAASLLSSLLQSASTSYVDNSNHSQIQRSRAHSSKSPVSPNHRGVVHG